jgi:hypothetical protein
MRSSLNASFYCGNHPLTAQLTCLSEGSPRAGMVGNFHVMPGINTNSIKGYLALPNINL